MGSEMCIRDRYSTGTSACTTGNWREQTAEHLLTPWCRKGHNIATAARSANVPSQRQRAVSALRCSCGANVQHRRQRAALAPMCYHSTNVSHSAHWQSGRHSVQSRRQCEALAPIRSLGSNAPSSISPQAFADCSNTRAVLSTTRASQQTSRVFGYSRHNRRVMAPLVRRTPCVRSTWAPVGILQPQWAAITRFNNAHSAPWETPGGGEGRAKPPPFCLNFWAQL